ncbi:MAG: DcaP family trimeric outer membrane transporter [Opitutales bacterium]
MYTPTRSIYVLVSLLWVQLLTAQPTPSEDENLHAAITELRAMVLSQQAEIESQKAQIRDLQKAVAEGQGSRSGLQQTNDSGQARSTLTQKNTTGRIPKEIQSEAEPTVSSRFNLDFYGYIKLDAAYDSQRTNPGDYAFYAEPESGTGDDDSFSMTAKQTRFGMKLEAPEFQEWTSTGGIEMDFYGSGSDNAANPRIRLAYLQLERGPWTILAGQHYDAWNTILPKSVNFATMGQHGSLWSRRPQVRATREFRPAGDGMLAATIGAARTIGTDDIDEDGDGLDGGEDSGLPMLQWNLKYMPSGSPKGATFALGGHYGREEVERNATDRDAKYATSLVMGSVHLPLHPQFKISGTLWTGENLGNFQGGIGQSLNLDQDTEIRASGGWVQASWYPSSTLNLNAAYGLDDPKNGDLAAGDRARNETFFTNLYWTFIPSTTFGLEYQYLNTDYKEQNDASTHRVQSAFIYKF